MESYLNRPICIIALQSRTMYLFAYKMMFFHV